LILEIGRQLHKQKLNFMKPSNRKTRNSFPRSTFGSNASWRILIASKCG
jgi:hypothetical protein